MAEITNIIESNVKALAPVDTGYLRSTISSAIKIFKSIIKVGAYYAVFQEYGTSKMRAANKGKGFVRFAYQLVRTRVGAIFGKEIRSKLRSM